jgi:raffinose/stachyose/melibiose transport system substrate-binding protein
VRENNIIDLTSAITQFGWDKTISQASMDAFTQDGKLYAAPYSLEAKYMYYNKPMFDQNGWQIPQTFAQLLELCRTIKAKGVTPMAFGNQERWEGVHYLSLFNQKIVGEKQSLLDYSRPAKDVLFTDLSMKQLFSDCWIFRTIAL